MNNGVSIVSDSCKFSLEVGIEPLNECCISDSWLAKVIKFRLDAHGHQLTDAHHSHSSSQTVTCHNDLGTWMGLLLS